MAEREEEISPVSPPTSDEKADSGKDPAVEVNLGEEETCRKSKRRKNCPADLQKLEEPEPLNRCFSFSFDTKIKSGRTPDSTPKFRSFNLVEDSRLLGANTTAAVEKDLHSDRMVKESCSGEEDEVDEEKKKKTEEAEDSTSVGD